MILNQLLATPNQTTRSSTPPVSSQTPGKAVRDIIHETADTQRTLHVMHCKHHLIEYPIAQWIDHCIESPKNSVWNPDYTQLVKKRLLESKKLALNGWSMLDLPVKLGGGEDATFAGIQQAVDAVIDAAKDVWSDKHRSRDLTRRAVYQTTPTRPSISATYGPRLKSDGRFTILRHVAPPITHGTLGRSARLQKLDPDSESGGMQPYIEGQLVSGVTADCAALAEFKINTTAKAEVCGTRSC